MNQQKPELNAPTQIVFWIIWFAILSGLFVIMMFAAGGLPSGENNGAAPLWIVLVSAIAAIAAMSIRFLVIPKINQIEKLMPAMIVALAISETIGILGLFIVSKDLPQTRLALFVTSVSCVIALAPVYVSALLNKRDKL